MSFTKKTIKDIKLQGKTVLLRADYNVPLDGAHITSDLRISQSIPTLQYLLEQGVRLVVCSHLGRPKGFEKKYSLQPVAKRLSKLLKQEVQFVHEAVGESVDKAKKQLKPGQVLLLENLRFYEEETKNDDKFAAELAKDVDIFVQDGFGVVHRAHASTSAVTKHTPVSVAGFLVEKEINAISSAVKSPKRPFTAIVGGAKISDKLDLINQFIDSADTVLVGGAMANTFLKAEGFDIGKSLYEPDMLSQAKKILVKARKKSRESNFMFYLPQDLVVSEALQTRTTTRIVDINAHAIANIESYPKLAPRITGRVKKTEGIYDIGPFSGAFMAGTVRMSSTVVWNGLMGVTEVPALHSPIGPFSHGTDLLVQAMTGQFGLGPKVVVGGGDTAGYVEKRGLQDMFFHVSTGGGASMELMVGKKLPGVEALSNKS